MITITVSKNSASASISGGDGGPGTIHNAVGISYNWSLPIGQLTNETNSAMVVQTLNSVMETVGGVAQTTSQSLPLSAGGGYDGDGITLGGTGLGANPGGGQLQVHGSYIDLSDVFDPNFADLSSLPVGSFFATPVAGVTKHNVVLVITE